MTDITPDNIFEKIISKEIPSYIVYEDDDTLAFLDNNPVNEGHTLVVPKEKYRNILDIPADVFSKVMKTAHMLSPIIKEAVDADGINIHINNEPQAGQEVFHLHVHIIPRFEQDGFKHWHGNKEYSKEDFSDTQEKIRAKM